MKRWRLTTLWLCSGLLFLSWVQGRSNPEEPRFEIPSPEGLIVPSREQVLGAVVLGQVRTISFREGEYVEKDGILLEMENKTQQLEVDRRRLLMESEAELEFARIRAQILEEELEAAEQLLERTRSVSREEINQRRLDYMMALTEVQRLEREQELAVIDYQLAEEELEKRRLRAPHSGTITRILVEEGEICQPGQPLLEMMDIRHCYLECHLSPELVALLELGQPVTVVVTQAGNTVELPGTIDLIAPTIDAASGLRRVRVLFENSELKVAPGQTARIRF